MTRRGFARSNSRPNSNADSISKKIGGRQENSRTELDRGTDATLALTTESIDAARCRRPSSEGERKRREQIFALELRQQLIHWPANSGALRRPIFLHEAANRPSLPAIPGSPIGGATRSCLCRGSVL